MLTNADMTLYRQNGTGYERQVVKEIFWEGSQISNAGKTGLISSDSISISVPYASAPNLQIMVGKDLVVQGVQTFEFDNTSESTVSTSMKQLKAMCEVHTVTACDPKLYGSEELWHYEMSCK